MKKRGKDDSSDEYIQKPVKKLRKSLSWKSWFRSLKSIWTNLVGLKVKNRYHWEGCNLHAGYGSGVWCILGFHFYIAE